MRVQGLTVGSGHLMLSDVFQRKGASQSQLPTQEADAAPSGSEMGYFFQFYRKPINQGEVN